MAPDMAALLTALVLLLLAFGAHVVVWRLRPPRRPLPALLAVFAFSLTGGAVVLLALGALWNWPLPALSQLPGIALFCLGATGSYLIIYTGIADASPSLVIIRALEAAPGRGCTRQDLAALFTEERLVLPRLNSLKDDH